MRRASVVVLLLLAGCATAAQREYQAISTGNKAIVDQAKVCVSAIYDSPDAAPLRGHYPVDPRDITLAQLSDTTMATPVEIAAIEAVHPRVQQCRKAVLDGLVNTLPGLVPVLTREYSGADDDLILLIQRKLPWGELTRRRRDRYATFQAAATAESQRVTANLQQQNEAELARRQAAAAAFAQWAQTQQAIDAMNRPVTTTCTASPGFANCVSR
jgi:hypothetical protein